ncbi:chymotrypsin family serine protease [Halorussus halophilus]|uniref:hypothetical protein n=1 Tax=Halorussus halophilus TaxID=2650975 RepID=UPI0013016030|nr:hypothetical protein [Halorussus halophilus]
MAGLGLSGAALEYISKDALAAVTSNPEKEVPRLLGLVHTNHKEVVSNNAVPEREPRFYTIPRDEWARTEAVHNAATRISRRFTSEPFIEVEVSSSDSELGIAVHYYEVHHADGTESTPNISFEKVKEAVPSRTDGSVTSNGKEYKTTDLKVTVHKSRAKEQATFNSNYRPVPSGVQMGLSNECCCTLGTPATALQDNSQVWVTAGHCINRTAGNNVHQPKNPLIGSNKIGESRQYTQKGNGDLGTVVSSGPDNSYNIADKNGSYGWQVSGVLSRDKLKDMHSNGESLYQQGRTTGRNTGKILGVKTNSPERVKIDHNVKGGDSGGPFFHITTDNLALIAGINHASIDDDGDGTFDEARGDIMAWAEEVLDVRV